MKCVQSWNYAKGAHWIWSNSSTLYIQRNLLPFTKENLLLVNAMRNNIKEHHLKVAIHKYKLSHSLSISRKQSHRRMQHSICLTSTNDVCSQIGAHCAVFGLFLVLFGIWVQIDNDPNLGFCFATAKRKYLAEQRRQNQPRNPNSNRTFARQLNWQEAKQIWWFYCS